MLDHVFASPFHSGNVSIILAIVHTPYSRFNLRYVNPLLHHAFDLPHPLQGRIDVWIVLVGLELFPRLVMLSHTHGKIVNTILIIGTKCSISRSLLMTLLGMIPLGLHGIQFFSFSTSVPSLMWQ